MSLLLTQIIGFKSKTQSIFTLTLTVLLIHILFFIIFYDCYRPIADSCIFEETVLWLKFTGPISREFRVTINIFQRAHLGFLECYILEYQFLMKQKTIKELPIRAIIGCSIRFFVDY